MVEQSKEAADLTSEQGEGLQRNLTNRHIQLIAIGGAIGTGLFMGSGKTISMAGPSIIFVYMIIGFMLFLSCAQWENYYSPTSTISHSAISLLTFLGHGQVSLPAGLTGSAGS